MKNIKKLFSFLFVALFAIMSVVSTVSAISGTNADKGSITIENAVKGEDYSIYQILKITEIQR